MKNYLKKIIIKNRRLSKEISYTGVLFLFFFILFIFNCKVSDDRLSDEEQRMLNEINAAIYQINEKPMEINKDEIKPMDFLRNSRIVGLGEATHGTKEFFQMKYQIFRYLVEKHGFRAIGFEADIGESIYLDRYIRSGNGDLRKLMKDKMHFWTWKTEEVYILLEWMKKYNEGKSKKEMIRYFGFDCQFQTFQGTLLAEYLKKVSPEYLKTLTGLFETMDSLNYRAYQQMVLDEFERIQNELEELFNVISNLKAEYMELLDLEDYEISKQLVISMIQTHVQIYRGQRGNYALRDKFMAENALWIRDFIGTDAKIVLWGHNSHIANDSAFASMNFTDKGPSMGNHLKNILGTDYQILGFSFSDGYFNAKNIDFDLVKCEINATPEKESLNNLFYNAKYNNFIFLINDLATSSEFRNWFSAQRNFLQIGSTFIGDPSNYYQSINKDYYDVFIHYNSTNEALILQ